ncbi:MAG: hypothetical protein R6W83_09475 [Cryobacterium sp.]
MLGLGAPLETATCSRAGCRRTATARLDWRNPRIHAEDRVKTWLACPDHTDYLSGFLQLRDFPLVVSALAATTPADADRGRLRE